MVAIENIVGNEAFARYERMLHFLQLFQKPSAIEALKGASVEERLTLSTTEAAPHRHLLAPLKTL